MSSYEDYTRASAEYDQTRVAVGEEIVLGALTKGRVPPRSARLLDAGCGTGSYAAAVEAHVGSLTLLDASEDMLLRAREKLADADGAEFHQGWLQQLPFDDSSFDAVMTNQVLHHIGDDDGGSWTEHEKVFAEYGRVLRPGGVLVVNTCSQLQLRHGYWYYTLIPAAVGVPVGARDCVVAGQAAFLYSLMSPSLRADLTIRGGAGSGSGLACGLLACGGRWARERWGRWVL